MRFLLETDHYVDDKLLPKFSYVGDGEGCVHDWRYVSDVKALNKKAGELRPLSSAMTPMDDEARKLLKKEKGTDKAEIDPTAAIPIQGTTNAPGLEFAKAPPPVLGK